MRQRTFVPGGIANDHGDIYGSSPLRIIRSGKMVIEAERAGAALMMGWRATEKPDGCDPDFAWIARTPEERP